MKKAVIFLFLVLIIITGVFLTCYNASAQGPYLGLEYGHDTGLVAQDVRLTVARIINVALGLLGMIAVVIVIYAGFKWMTAGGNEEDASSAKKILYAAVIGLVIILAAYSISRFVITQLFKATTGYDYEAITGDY